MYNEVASTTQAALVDTGPARKIAASACIRHSVIHGHGYMYVLFRRSQGMSSLIAAASACAYVSQRAEKTGPGTAVSGPAERAGPF